LAAFLPCCAAFAFGEFYKADGRPFIELARAYENGVGVPKNEEKAFDYYFMAAVEWNKANPEALEYLKKRAEEGNKYAQYYYGCYWDYDEMRSFDSQKALYWYKKAAEQNYSQAFVRIGAHYYFDENDKKKGIEYFLKAAEMGNPIAYGNLASSCVNGDLEKRDYKKAIEYWIKASKLGHASSDYMLGVCYIYGIEVPADAKKAFEYFLQSAKGGYTPAKRAVGLCYAFGVGTERNEAEGQKWLTEYYTKSGNSEKIKQIMDASKTYKSLEKLGFCPWFYKPYLEHKKLLEESAKERDASVPLKP